MRKIKFLLVVLVCLAFMPNVYAKTVNHFYAEAGDDVTYEKEVNGSSALAGQNVESKGKILGVNFLAGNKVSHEGYSEYLVAAGNDINISGEVVNDAIIAGNVITVDKDSSLKRDVIILGENITVKGSLGRNVTLYGNKVSLEGATVKGNVKIRAEEIVVDESSIVEGVLSYPEDVQLKNDGTVKSTKKTAAINNDVTNDLTTFITDKIWSFMSLLVIFAVLTLMAPKLFDKINKDYEKLDFSKGVELTAKGLVFLMLVPVIAVFLLVIPFALPLSLIMLALYCVIIYVSKIFAMYLLGFKLWQKFLKKDMNVLLVGILGFVVTFVLSLIPGVSFIVSMLTLLIGIGIIATFLFPKKA